MDYTKPLLLALESAKCKTSGWNTPSIDKAIGAVKERSRRGTINAKNALLISTLFPAAFAFASTPLKELKKEEAGQGPEPSNLAPVITQGLSSWYWNLTNFVSLTSPSSNSGVLFIIKQTTIDAASGLSVWSIDAGAVDPDSKKWVSPETVYLDSDMVRVIRNGIKIMPNPQISGHVAVSATGFSISVNFTSSGFNFQVSSTSRRGPTYEQGSGNVKRIGPIQNGYWSIVDGSTTSGVLSTTSTSKTHNYNAKGSGNPNGMSWLDYQQLGLAGVTHFEQMLASAVKAPASEMKWLFFVIQTADFQLDGYLLFNILKKGEVSNLHARRSVFGKKTINYWKAGNIALYDLNCTIQILDVYPETFAVGGVPSAIAVTIQSPGLDNVTYTLTSITSTIPSLITAGGSGYESPSTVTWNDASGTKQYGTGVIEWVPGGMYPTKADVFKESGISRNILKSADPNPNAQAFLSFMLIFVVFFVISLVLIPIYATRRK